jgi:hypothetical protein
LQENNKLPERITSAARRIRLMFFILGVSRIITSVNRTKR